VQGVVQAPIAGSGEAVPNLFAGGGIDGCGAVVGGEVVPGREAVDVLNLGQDPAGDDRANAVEIGQVRCAGRDELADLVTRRFDLRVEGLDVRDVFAGELDPHDVDRGVWTQQSQCA
jgi:hypothetical protein